MRRTNLAVGMECLEYRTLLTAAPFFTGLGDLPGGSFGSGATGVSDDGQTVVGYSFVTDHPIQVTSKPSVGLLAIKQWSR